MFHFGTTHNQERRDGFVSFRCFSLARRRRGEDERGRERTEEEGNGNLRRMGEDSDRMKEDGDEDGHRTLRREKKGLRTGRNQDFEKEKIEHHESCDSIAVFR